MAFRQGHGHGGMSHPRPRWTEVRPLAVRIAVAVLMVASILAPWWVLIVSWSNTYVGEIGRSESDFGLLSGSHHARFPGGSLSETLDYRLFPNMAPVFGAATWLSLLALGAVVASVFLSLVRRRWASL